MQFAVDTGIRHGIVVHLYTADVSTYTASDCLVFLLLFVVAVDFILMNSNCLIGARTFQ